MNCQIVKPLLSEFLDERLDAGTAWQVQTHVTHCAACGKVCRDLETLSRSLRALPTHGPSANFDSALAQRLALTRRPLPPQTWRARLARAFPRPVSLLRPVLALGAAAAAVGGILLLPAPTPAPDTRTAVRTADHAFVADCVAQRRREAAGEPLADPAAQNLAGNLDAAAPGQTEALPVGDAGVF